MNRDTTKAALAASLTALGSNDPKDHLTAAEAHFQAAQDCAARGDAAGAKRHQAYSDHHRGRLEAPPEPKEVEKATAVAPSGGAAGHYPAGTPGGKGGQFAPKSGGGAGGGASSVPGAKTPYDTHAIVSLRRQLGTFPQTHMINTPARTALRKQITRELYGSGASQKGKRIDIVMGGPGTGKSSVIGNEIKAKHGSLEVDSDLAKEKIPEFMGGKNANGVHVESVAINAHVLAMARQAGDNILLPVVGKSEDGLKSTIREFHQAGYDVHLHYVDVPKEVATQRAISRFEQTGRFVDPDYVYNEVGNRPRSVFSSIKTYPRISTATHYDNNVPFGQPARVVESRTNQPVQPGERGGRLRGGSPASQQRGRGGPRGFGKSGEPGRQLGMMDFPTALALVKERASAPHTN